MSNLCTGFVSRTSEGRNFELPCTLSPNHGGQHRDRIDELAQQLHHANHILDKIRKILPYDVDRSAKPWWKKWKT